ncbi:MAG: hypothetical protein U9N34_08485, partial [Candidatus Cloacimonadota bacterium]|nr:hypothetical protein [Candidatus Cloacimonadota bacterium]
MESFETGKEYLKSLGKNHYEIISAICQFSELPHFDFIEMFGEGILIKDRQYSYTNRTIYKVSKEYSYLKVNDKSVFITQSLQKEFQKYVDKHKDATLKNSEHPKTTNTFSNENDAFEFLGIISDFYNNKVVKLTAAKKFKKKDSLQILNSISLQKIFPDDKDKNSEVFIQFLNAVVAGLSFKVNKISDLQQIYENFLSENYIILKFMNIPGSYYRKNWYAERASDGYFEAVYEMLRNFPLNFWVSIKNIKTYFKLNNFSESFSQALGFDNYYFINSSFLTSYRSEEISREIDDSIIKSIFGYLSILGLFEIAYNKPEGVSKTTMQNKQYLSVFDGLQSVKMTELGEYILGFRDSYEVKKKTENICKFTFSKYELKVSLSTKSPRDEVFFKAISHTSSDLTYWISFKSIIKNSEDNKHLLQILKTFEK